MGKDKITRFLDSESEEELNSYNRFKKKKILEVHSSTEKVIENENLQNSTFKEGFREHRSGTYIQKIRKIKRNSGKRYDTQSEKNIPFQSFSK